MKRVFTQTFGAAGAIIVKDGKVLLVKETKESVAGKWNHPAGWIDVGEDPIDAAKREVKEETGFDFTPTHLLGVYSLIKEEGGNKKQPIKIIFIGDISDKNRTALTEDVSENKWFTPEEIENMEPETLRDLDIKQMVKDYFSGKKYPLDVLNHTISE